MNDEVYMDISRGYGSFSEELKQQRNTDFSERINWSLYVP